MDWNSLDQDLQDGEAMEEHHDLRGRWQGWQRSSRLFRPVVANDALLQVLSTSRSADGNPMGTRWTVHNMLLKDWRIRTSLFAYQGPKKPFGRASFPPGCIDQSWPLWLKLNQSYKTGQVYEAVDFYSNASLPSRVWVAGSLNHLCCNRSRASQRTPCDPTAQY